MFPVPALRTERANLRASSHASRPRMNWQRSQNGRSSGPGSCTVSHFRLFSLSNPSPSLFTPRRPRPLDRVPSLVTLPGSLTYSRLLGIASLRALLPCGALPRAPFLRRRYPASLVLRASPPPADLPLAGFRLARARHRQGFPCCCLLHLPCMPTPRWKRSVLLSFSSRPSSAFPWFPEGQLPHYTFRGLVYCSFRPACSLSGLRRPSARVLQPHLRKPPWLTGTTVVGWGIRTHQTLMIGARSPRSM